MNLINNFAVIMLVVGLTVANPLVSIVALSSNEPTDIVDGILDDIVDSRDGLLDSGYGVYAHDGIIDKGYMTMENPNNIATISNGDDNTASQINTLEMEKLAHGGLIDDGTALWSGKLEVIPKEQESHVEGKEEVVEQELHGGLIDDGLAPWSGLLDEVTNENNNKQSHEANEEIGNQLEVQIEEEHGGLIDNGDALWSGTLETEETIINHEEQQAGILDDGLATWSGLVEEIVDQPEKSEE